VGKIRESGTTVVLIEQYIHEALKISDHVNIMRRGEVILSDATANLNSVEQIHEKYFGVTTKQEEGKEKPRVEILKESLQNWRKATNKISKRA
jgi:ABC-type sugar transport system ATPase subunit